MKNSIKFKQMMEKNFWTEKMKTPHERFTSSFSIARQQSLRNNSYEIEKRLLSCIKRGDTDGVIAVMNDDSIEKPQVILASEPLRSQKNLIIALTAVVVRTVISTGVPAEIAFILSDSYIQLVEEADDVEAAVLLMNTMLCDFSEIVKFNMEMSYTGPVKKSIDYIFMHLYDEISVKHMAEELHFNANYLSRIFKSETGTTISEFIMMERINESKKLLSFTKYSIMDIVALLHFHDQSHFTRVFKKQVGTTPKKYRDLHWKNMI